MWKALFLVNQEKQERLVKRLKLMKTVHVVNLVVIKWLSGEQKKQTVAVAVDDRYWSICKRKKRELLWEPVQLEIEKVNYKFSKYGCMAQ